MKAARDIALAAMLAVSVLGSATCSTGRLVFPLGSEDAQAVLSALVEMANKPEYSGSYTYPCLSGGDAEVTAAIDDEEFPYRVTGMWEIEIDECQLGYSDVTIEVGYFAFTSNNVAEAETETRRFEAAVEAWFRWARLPDNRRFRCDRGLTDISGVFEAGLDEPYTGSLDGLFCEEAVEIPVSSFPGNWTF